MLFKQDLFNSYTTFPYMCPLQHCQILVLTQQIDFLSVGNLEHIYMKIWTHYFHSSKKAKKNKPKPIKTDIHS